MSNSLKDALIKAGVISKDTIEREKEKERREKIQKLGPEQKGVHMHHMRTDCDNCKRNTSDVEYYEHTNRSVDGKWFCVECADKLWIKDECRQTNQSSHAKSGFFRRQFGATKVFAHKPAAPPPAPAKPLKFDPPKPRPNNFNKPRGTHGGPKKPGGSK